MSPGEWDLESDPLDDRPTFLAHALVLSAHHFNTEPVPAAVAETVDLLEEMVSTQPLPGALAGLHELLARQSAVAIADDLVKELRSRSLPGEPLREVSRHLTEHGSLRNAVKLGIVTLGLRGRARP
jgi:hypothetical protein